MRRSIIMIKYTHAISISWLLCFLQQRTTTGFTPSAQPQTPSVREKVDGFLSTLQKPEETLDKHIYLKGNYAPVLEEYVRAPVKVVAGSIPKDLVGMFSRNGPNPIPSRMTKLYHWFDGYAMLHNLRFESDGKAWYTNQFVPDNRYLVETELNRSFFPTLGEYTGIFGLAKTLFHTDMVRERVPDITTVVAANTNCLMYRNKFYLLNEANLPLECKILPDGRLERVGFEYFDGTLDFPVSAHPRVDQFSGDLFFHAYTTSPELQKSQGTVKMGRFSNESGKIESYFVPTTAKYVPFAHNLLITEHHVIIYDLSVHFDVSAMFVGGSYFRNNPDYTLRFGVMPKTATSREDVQWFDTGAPGTIVHPMNAWEDKDDGIIKIWTPVCPEADLDLDNPDFLNKFDMKEYTIDLDKLDIAEKTIDDSVNIEFCNVRSFGEFNRYGYASIQDIATPGEGSFAGFTIWDMQEGRLCKSVRYDENEAGGEVVVIPRPGTEDVYVGVYIHDLVKDESYFDVYDGVTGKRVVRLQMPYRVPFGFHGVWLSEDELQSHFAHDEGQAQL